ncbi:MAG: phosphoethanolamine transferase [Muribaculaceae bacterium]|nr:phosphoethanolamine transferase [Muribaculaceae bacterium]
MRFNSAIAILMLQTNLSESKEFIDFAMIPILKAMLCSIIIITTILLWNYYWKHGLASRVGKCLRLNNRVVVCIVGGLLALSAYYTPLRIVQCIRGNDMYWMRLTSMPDASTIVTYYYGFMDSVFNPEIRELDKLAATIEKTSVNKDNAKKEFVIVYVIGESFGRGRSSLFGYPMETNPNMKLEMDNGSLMVYDNVVSHSSQTINVYRYMLSMCDILGDSGFVEYPLLPSILKKCGYYVSYYDNQSVLNSAKIDFGCTFFLSNKDVQQQSIDEYNKANEDYDGTFTLVYQPRKDCARSLTIYHLMGQHVDYKSRYPADFAKFSAADYSSFGYTNDQAEKMAEYDNATRYNDYVLSKIIDNLRNDIAIMVYAPDHGDEIYDYRDCVGRYLNFPEESIRLLFEVPVMIWVSDKYKELYPDEVEMLRKNEHKAIYNSDLSHTILDIAGIETESFRPDLSLLRDGDGRTNRRILQNNFEYDANRDKIRSYKMRYEK